MAKDKAKTKEEQAAEARLRNIPEGHRPEEFLNDEDLMEYHRLLALDARDEHGEGHAKAEDARQKFLHHARSAMLTKASLMPLDEPAEPDIS